ncbi:hypothetical protein GWI33_021638 [Rhynchophorus ferrugineus]|uniref:Alpha 1,4-glycosyltransferase domain-containing protein n=1 Tax=Rhynchophorus ferrugineus TaxID=354439 RepID=A0A834IVR0_RHYFE|nr:hypothetical protein GWI33_021638 [Rhynchophorus ferrugineus]
MYKQYYKVVNSKHELYCHSLDVLDKLVDIQDTHVKNDSAVFFLDTSCNSFINGKITITARQACAVESAALMNPYKQIYLLHSSPGLLIDDKSESTQILKSLGSYSNINILHINLDRFVKGSPVEELWKSKKVYESKFPLTHISDIFRVLLLWRYGGIYMDLDVIVTKNLELLPANFIGAESKSDLNNDVIGLSSKSVGQQFAQELLELLNKNYNGQSWTGNSVSIFNRLAKKWCDKKDVSATVGMNCKSINILKQKVLYPIGYKSWKKLFDDKQVDAFKKDITESYVVHFWNKMSGDTKIPIYSEVPYLQLAREYCPETLRNSLYYF